MKYIGTVVPVLLASAIWAANPVTRTLVWSDPPQEQLPDAYIIYSSKTMSAPLSIWLPMVTMPAYHFVDTITNNVRVSLTYKDGQGWHAVVWNNDLNVQQTNTIVSTTQLSLAMDTTSNNYFFIVSSNATGLSGPSNLASSPAAPVGPPLQIK